MIRERVVGIRNARTKGKSLGRPKRVLLRDEAVQLRADGLTYGQIAVRVELPLSTVDIQVGSHTGQMSTRT